MKKSLIALAAAGALASGAAAADSFAVRVHDGNLRAYTVQHYSGYDVRRWDDWRHNSIDERQARIHMRIRNGFERGDLTRREARRLSRELADIEAKQRHYQADGRLGPREQRELHADLDRLAANLRWERRDDDRRY